MKTLRLILESQDLGQVEEVCDKVLNGEKVDDPITQIIVNAHQSSVEFEDVNQGISEIEYAIDQLTRAKIAMETTE